MRVALRGQLLLHGFGQVDVPVRAPADRAASAAEHLDHLEPPLAANRARSSTKRSLSMSEAKAQVVKAIRDGLSVKDAMGLVDRSEYTYKDWRDQDAEFARQVDEVREVARAARQRGSGGRVEVPDFPEFCAEYLNMPLPEHHLRVWDVINGRQPRNLHPSIRWAKGRDNRLLLNFAPFHAKTQVWSVQYPLWRMMKDPNVRIAIVSKTQALAKKIIHQITQILQLPQYAKLHAAFMPEGGWKGDGWTKFEIYLSGVDVAQKDPTLQALGLGGQIYGSRLDVILLDDLVDMKNVHTYKELADWVGTEVDSRVDDDGLLACLGTRLAPDDIYSELRDLVDWDDETPVWTYFAQPAVLEMPEHDPNTWVTLWPALADGKPMWNGMSLARKKAVLPSEARWQLTYQQMDASIEQVFPSGAVAASVDHRRAAGPMDGLYTVLGVDPAADGFTAMMVVGYDKASGQRFVLDGCNVAKMQPERLISQIMQFVDKYAIREVVVERNAFQGFLSRNESLRAYCYSKGCLLTEHYTGAQKWDENLGVAALAPLFLSCANHDLVADRWTPTPFDKHLISLPNPKFSTFVDSLITQLTTWQPRTGRQITVTDLVMALWFANIGIQKVIDHARNAPRHLDNPFITRADARSRNVVNLQSMREDMLRRGSDRTIDFATGRAL
jgi:ribosomal protein L7/L12